MIDINELRRLTQAVVKGWGNCDQAWLDQSEDAPAAVVGHIDEDGNTYPVATIDCDQYCAGHQSLPLAKFYAAAGPAAISELLDRLEEAESDALEQARLNGMGGEREAALMAKLEAAEKERDEFKRACFGHISDNSMLRAKIAEMERQEPVKYEFQDRDGKWHPFIDQRHYENTVAVGAWPIRSLYTLPGAKGEDK